MSLQTVIARLLLVMNLLAAFSDPVRAEILSPPTKIPYAKDVIIERYAHGQPLKLFKQTGKWEAKTFGKSLSIIGMADVTSAYLLSNDLLSRKPKSFKFDFIVKDFNKEFGFIYGDIGVLVVNNKMYYAAFDSKTNMLKMISSNGKTIGRELNGKSNTLDINTGYDPTGGPNQVCVIYVNGAGLTFNCSNTDSSFGVYLSPKSRITINNIRWSIGSK